MSILIKIKYASCADRNLKLPEYKTDASAGCDLPVHLKKENRDDGFTLYPGQRKLFNLGIILEIPIGFEGQIRSRSGLALKYGIGVINSPGTIDSDYRGELKVIIINWGNQIYKINHGERIAQLVISSVEKVNFCLVSEFSKTKRDKQGFGSTGK
tara:strand:+ start:236 stop:700 length:465 start_codon:yes stop_codon:yes gene_type:complete